MTDTGYSVPLIIRGEVIEDGDVEHGGRGGGVSFRSPDVRRHLDRLPLRSPGAMADLYRLSFEEILDFLGALGQRLTLSQNRWVQQAFDLSCRTSGLGADILRNMYENMGALLDRESLREVADRTIGIPHLEGWVETRLDNGLLASSPAPFTPDWSRRALRCPRRLKPSPSIKPRRRVGRR